MFAAALIVAVVIVVALAAYRKGRVDGLRASRPVRTSFAAPALHRDVERVRLIRIDQPGRD